MTILAGQKRFTAIEKMLIAAACLVSVLVALAVYVALSGDTRAARAKAQVIQIKNRTHQLFEGAGSYAGYTMAQAANAHVFDGMIADEKTGVRNAYGGDVRIDMAEEGSVFTLAFDNIPQSACAGLASAFTQDPDFVRVYVSGSGTQGASPHMGAAATAQKLQADCKFQLARITWWFR